MTVPNQAYTKAYVCQVSGSIFTKGLAKSMEDQLQRTPTGFEHEMFLHQQRLSKLCNENIPAVTDNFVILHTLKKMSAVPIS